MFGFFTIIAIFIIAVVLAGISIYNGLVKLRTNVEEGWSGIDVQLKRRYDLIPNLVETVKGYASHESDTLKAVMEARAKATSIKIDASSVTAEQMAAFSQAQSGLSGALGKLLAVSENYPELKANQNFLQLQDELANTESAIQSARRYYNGTVRDYNIKVDTVPSNIVANIFNFTKKEFFEIAETEKEAPKVSF